MSGVFRELQADFEQIDNELAARRARILAEAEKRHLNLSKDVDSLPITQLINEVEQAQIEDNHQIIGLAFKDSLGSKSSHHNYPAHRAPRPKKV